MSDFSQLVLSGTAFAVLKQLWAKGPTWDGNIVSKRGRGELVDRGLAFHVAGYASLTEAGVRLAAGGTLDRKE